MTRLGRGSPCTRAATSVGLLTLALSGGRTGQSGSGLPVFSARRRHRVDVPPPEFFGSTTGEYRERAGVGPVSQRRSLVVGRRPRSTHSFALPGGYGKRRAVWLAAAASPTGKPSIATHDRLARPSTAHRRAEPPPVSPHPPQDGQHNGRAQESQEQPHAHTVPPTVAQ
jgi:hypothetical protein